MAASLKASSLYRSWKNGDSMDKSDAERLFGTENVKVTKPVSCRSYWALYAGLTLFLALFLFGIVVGFYLRADPKVADGCSVLKRKDGFDDEHVQAVHNNIMHYMSGRNTRQQYRHLSELTSGRDSNDDRLSAQYVAREFRKYGFHQVELQEHELVVTSPDPRHPNRLEILQADGSTRLNVTINRNRESHASASHTEHAINLPPSGSSNFSRITQGRVVFGNQGSHVDYVKLRTANISVRGSVMLLRVGLVPVKEMVQRAEYAGAVGVILYCQEENDTKCFHGNIDQIMTTVAGLTADVSMPTIPVQAVSQFIAQQILGNMSTTSLLADWKRDLKNSSRETTSGREDDLDLVVRLHLNSVRRHRKIYNVVGTLYGSEQADRVVMVGADRYAGIRGSRDHNTDTSRGMEGPERPRAARDHNTAMLLELARSLGYIHQHQGWTPRRSVRLCSWSVNSYSGIGQELYVKANRHIIQQEVVTYIDLDLQWTGSDVIRIESSPALLQMIRTATAMVPDPSNPELSLADSWPALSHDMVSSNENPVHIYSATPSNYPLLQELGIPTSDVHLVEAHGVKDNNDVQGENYRLAAARVVSLMTLRLVDDVRLPFSVQSYTDYVRASLTASLNLLSRKIPLAQGRIDTLLKVINHLSDISNRSSASPEACISTVKLQHDNDVLMRLDSIFVDVFLNHSSQFYILAQEPETGALSSFLEVTEEYTVTKDLDAVYNFLDTISNIVEESIEEVTSLHQR